METPRTRISIAPDLPRKKDLKNDLLNFGLLNLLVVGLVALMFVGKIAAPAKGDTIGASASSAAADTQPYNHPGLYGRTSR